MADQKANILIGLMVISATMLLTKLPNLMASRQGLPAPFYLVLALEIAGLICCLLVLIPRRSGMRRFSKIQEVPNPLFFGFFTQFTEEEYVGYLMGELGDSRAAQEYLIRDYYQMGQVARKKFQLLKYAYLFAVSGILILLCYFLYGVLYP
jgi:hypothetical protein